MIAKFSAGLFGHRVSLEELAGWVSWNLFLALIPVLLAYLFLAATRNMNGKARPLKIAAATVLFILWLAFVPNTCYLITEWKHFLDFVVGTAVYGGGGTQEKQFAICTQSVFYLLYSGAGVLCFVLSVRPMEQMLRSRGIHFALFAVPLFTLMSIGVYLGRSPKYRFNSWDLLDRPGAVLRAIAHIPYNHLVLFAVVVFALLLWGLYEGLDLWVDGVVERRKRWLKR